MMDWNTIKTEYITGDDSYKVLAGKWGVSFRTLSQKGQKEGWFPARLEYRDSVVKKIVRKRASQTAGNTVEKLSRLQTSADAMSELIFNTLADADQFHRYIVTRSLGGGATEKEERLFDKVDTKAIRDLTAAMRDLAAVIRSVYDIPTRVEQSAMDIAAAKLEISRKKNEHTDDTDGETGVVELTPVIQDVSDDEGEKLE